MDKPPGVQETQGVEDLQQNVQDGLCLQHWELCTLGKKTPQKHQICTAGLGNLMGEKVILIYCNYYSPRKAANMKFIGGKGGN